MKHLPARQAASGVRAPFISQVTSWGAFAYAMRERVDVDMSGTEAPFTSADYNAPTEPDHPAVFWEYVDESPTIAGPHVDEYTTRPMEVV